MGGSVRCTALQKQQIPQILNEKDGVYVQWKSLLMHVLIIKI